ncbi:MAG: FIST C-terminal domain-containing protein [Bacteroidia bacterium]|nr:FIST C-terminal domain-containing protein [Bacteroidia bacterium]
MKTAQYKFTPELGWNFINGDEAINDASLVLVFGSSANIKNADNLSEIKNKFNKAIFLGSSTSGEIIGVNVVDDTIIATAILFEKTTLQYKHIEIESSEDSYNAGFELINSLDKENLKHVFVLSDGLNVNGSELVNGLRKNLPEGVSVTGGLAGDGANFKETFIVTNNANSKSKTIAVLGFYGNHIHIGYGSLGGWDSFGIERLVSKSKNNVLYELDSKPALALYKSFLGDEYAKELPSSGLLFPLNLRIKHNDTPVVRTILAVDEETQSLTFAGDIPEGGYVRLMKANFDRLIDGAVGAAQSTLINSKTNNPDLAILISCVGRKLVLKQIIEEEVEGVREVLGEDTALCGFYSYGEISPFSLDAKCELHNQTMTITTFKEDK